MKGEDSALQPRGRPSRRESGSTAVSGLRLLEVVGLGFKRVVHLQSKATRSSEPA